MGITGIGAVEVNSTFSIRHCGMYDDGGKLENASSAGESHAISTPRGMQPFRHFSHVKASMKEISVNARHIPFDDLLDNQCEPISPQRYGAYGGSGSHAGGVCLSHAPSPLAYGYFHHRNASQQGVSIP